ncbi:MAG: LysR family transcriptional regulator [Planctomycetes bacterium]|nr:LysR family transcriptional regulator [Planctomycetota bacterium]
MRRSLPGTAALQAFESAAFHGTITAAARELSRTQSALTRQIQALEAHLGVALFERRRQRIRLTPDGERYLEHVRAAFDRLEAAALELRTPGSGGVLRLGILPTYGTRWLIPRFPTFAAAHPAIQVHFTTRLSVFDFASEDLDAAIHYGEGHWPGAACEPLMDEEVLVVCSARYRDERQLREPRDLARATLLQISSRPQAFDDWLQARAVDGVDGRRGPRFEHHQMALEAAIAGLGVAVLPAFVVDDELLRGTVVEAFEASRARTGKGYWLAYPERRATLPALRAFRDWLLAQHGRPAQARSSSVRAST